MSLNTAVMTGSRIFGPAIAAMLVGPLGTGWCSWSTRLSFLAIIGLAARDRPGELYRAPRRPRGGTPVRDAMRFVAERSAAATSMFIVFAVVSTFAFNYNVSLLKLADERFGERRVFGWLLAVSEHRQRRRLAAHGRAASP